MYGRASKREIWTKADGLITLKGMGIEEGLFTLKTMDLLKCIL